MNTAYFLTKNMEKKKDSIWKVQIKLFNLHFKNKNPFFLNETNGVILRLVNWINLWFQC